VPLDVRATLSSAEGAFIGTLVNRRQAPQPPPTGPAQPIGDDIFTFRVDEAVKGALGNTVDVWSSSSGASCGLEIGIGQRIGLFLRRQGERWTSLLCLQVSPAALRDAARPLPRPDGRGPVRFLVGGGFGGARLIALDGRGRTLGYGSGSGPTTRLSVCPRGRRAVEIAGEPGRVAIRSLRTMTVIREVSLQLGSNPVNVYCRDAAARDVYVFGRRGPAAEGVILRISAGEAREIYAGSARASVFRRGFVYLSEGDGQEIVRLDLSSGVRNRIATAPLGINNLALSPDGTQLAGVHSEGSSATPARLVVLDLAAPESAIRIVAFGTPWFAGKLVWVDDSRLAVFPYRGAALVFDIRLRRIARLGAWQATDSIVISGVAYGMARSTTAHTVRGAPGWLRSARLPQGPVRHLRRLPSGAGVIAAVPGRVVLRAPRRPFCLALERVFPGV
jgi:hypothetical protein